MRLFVQKLRVPSSLRHVFTAAHERVKTLIGRQEPVRLFDSAVQVTFAVNAMPPWSALTLHPRSVFPIHAPAELALTDLPEA